MINIDIDASGLVIRMNLAADRFDDIGDGMLEVCDDGASYLRETDWYQNRTGDLRANTQAVRIDENTVELHMDTEYAKYVAPDWSGFDEVSAEVEEQIVGGLRKMVGRI